MGTRNHYNGVEVIEEWLKNMGESIFTRYIGKRKILVKNKNVLQSSFVPECLPHRSKEIESIVEIIAPSLNKDKPSNILITGKTGTGKTAVLNYIARELKKEDPSELNCSYTYVNCEIATNPITILYNISNQIITEDEKKIPFTGWSTEKVYTTLTSYIDEKNKVYLVVLDEIDFVFKSGGEEIFYYLTTMNEILKNSKVSIIGITNDTKFTELLSPKIKSRLGEEKIIFKSYTSSQLQDILRERSDIAFEPGILKEDVIPYCAAISSKDSGDARKALDLLRTAADMAERNGDSEITIAHIKYARDKIELDAVSEIIKSLPDNFKIVLMSVIKNHENFEKITTGDVFTVYREICNMIGYTILSQRSVSGMISELDMLGLIHTTTKSYGRNGRTKEIELTINSETIELIVSDELFKPLSKYKPKKQTTLFSNDSENK
ncbi:MAG: orc1/cdc6 family replication initiation protein [Candidatus Methanoplasma sp.]|jgi:cell division control protein 6|nr:orc1/cdc6 family replication initiation protein [Candidatus Methanoplasma sp.]